VFTASKRLHRTSAVSVELQQRLYRCGARDDSSFPIRADESNRNPVTQSMIPKPHPTVAYVSRYRQNSLRLPGRFGGRIDQRWAHCGPVSLQTQIRRIYRISGLTADENKKKNLFPVGKYNINTQNAYKHQIFITAYRRLPESFYKLSMLATYNTK